MKNRLLASARLFRKSPFLLKEFCFFFFFNPQTGTTTWFLSRFYLLSKFLTAQRVCVPIEACGVFWTLGWWRTLLRAAWPCQTPLPTPCRGTPPLAGAGAGGTGPAAVAWQADESIARGPARQNPQCGSLRRTPCSSLQLVSGEKPAAVRCGSRRRVRGSTAAKRSGWRLN